MGRRQVEEEIWVGMEWRKKGKKYEREKSIDGLGWRGGSMQGVGQSWAGEMGLSTARQMRLVRWRKREKSEGRVGEVNSVRREEQQEEMRKEEKRKQKKKRKEIIQII